MSCPPATDLYGTQLGCGFFSHRSLIPSATEKTMALSFPGALKLRREQVIAQLQSTIEKNSDSDSSSNGRVPPQDEAAEVRVVRSSFPGEDRAVSAAPVRQSVRVRPKWIQTRQPLTNISSKSGDSKVELALQLLLQPRPILTAPAIAPLAERLHPNGKQISENHEPEPQSATSSHPTVGGSHSNVEPHSEDQPRASPNSSPSPPTVEMIHANAESMDRPQAHLPETPSLSDEIDSHFMQSTASWREHVDHRPRHVVSNSPRRTMTKTSATERPVPTVRLAPHSKSKLVQPARRASSNRSKPSTALTPHGKPRDQAEASRILRLQRIGEPSSRALRDALAVVDPEVAKFNRQAASLLRVQQTAEKASATSDVVEHEAMLRRLRNL